MPTVNLTVPPKLKAAIDQRVASGEYTGPGDYLRELVRRDQQRQKSRRLEDLLLHRLDRADAVDMNAADFKRIRQRFLKRVIRARSA